MCVLNNNSAAGYVRAKLKAWHAFGTDIAVLSTTHIVEDDTDIIVVTAVAEKEFFEWKVWLEPDDSGHNRIYGEC